MRSDDAAGGFVPGSVHWDPSKFPKSGRDDEGWLWRNPVAVLVIALLVSAVGAWFMASMAPIAIELREGIHATGAARNRGTGGDAEWWVTFDGAGKTETHRLLPENVGKRLLDDGDRIDIVYNPANPSHVAREDDVGVGALLLPSAMLLVGLILLVTSGVVWFRRRHPVQPRGTANPAPTSGHNRFRVTD